MKRNNTLVNAVIIILVIVCAISIIPLRIQLGTLIREKAELKAEIDDCLDDIDELRYYASLPESEYIEFMARKMLGYHYPGEIIFRSDS